MNIYILSTLETGLDSINYIHPKHPITGVIGLSDRSKKNDISGFFYFKDICLEKQIDFIEIEDYSFKNQDDINHIQALDIDVLLVNGWQRLIPEWLINHCSYFPVGAHGSPLGITKGRGRSPQNWALITGKKEFYISIFKIAPGIDDGDIIDTISFKYSEFDDIKTSYFKIALCVSEMQVRLINKLKTNAKINLTTQDHQNCRYYPQRKPEDGYIDWFRSNNQIRNFVRALTNPYPGAKTISENNVELKILEIIPFDLDINIKKDAEVGEIVYIFNKKELLMKTQESFMLIREFESSVTNIELIGEKFISKDYIKQLQNIKDRHQKKHPNLPLADLNSID